jgi:putative flippase GtrA
MARFAPAAMVALAASQLVYFLSGSVWHLTGRVTGAAAWLAGAVVSYGASRWAWERRGRPRLLQETVPFLAISVVTGPVLIEASHFGYREAGALGLHGIAFHAFTQGFYLAANGITFIVRFVLFNFVVFADRTVGVPGLYAKYRQLIHESARFGVVGLAGLVVTVGGANLLRYQAGMGRLSAVAIATAVATAVTFAGSRYWTYRHRERTGLGWETALFFAVNAIGVAIAEVPVGLTYPLRLDGAVAYNIALYCGIMLATMFRYWSYRTWVWPTGALSSAGAPLPVPAHSQLASSVQQGKLGQVLRGRCWRLVFEFASFSVVAGCAWLVTDVVFKLLVMQAGVEPLAWGVVSVAVATVVSFVGNRYWTFRQRQRTTVHREGFRYLVFTGAGLIIQIAVGSMALHYRLSPDGALMLALGVGILFRYWSCRTWVWRARQSAPSIVT